MVCISLLLLAVIQRITAPSIESNQAAAAKKLIESVLPEGYLELLTQDHLDALKKNTADKTSSTQIIKHCNSEFLTLIQTQTNGYSSQLTTITSILSNTDASGQTIHRIVGARVIPPQQETPGLGDIIMFEKSTWILQFNNLKLPFDLPLDKNQVNKNQAQQLTDSLDYLTDKVDYVTGATISTNAVIKAVARAIQLPISQPTCALKHSDQDTIKLTK